MVLPLPTLIFIEVVVFAVLEAKRYEGYKKTGKSGFLGSFPFDPAGLDSPANREKEIKNGRLGALLPPSNLNIGKLARIAAESRWCRCHSCLAPCTNIAFCSCSQCLR